MTPASVIGIGTAAFGLDYGLTNTAGAVSPGAVREILVLASEEGIGLLDTAALYGDAESVLGDALCHVPPLQVVTKTVPIPGDTVTAADCDAVERGFERSLERLAADSVHGLLVHQAADLMKPGADRLIRTLESLKAAGRVRKIGVSLYSTAQLNAIRKRFRPDLVQVPMNILDQRFLSDGVTDALHRQGTEIHARSVFLQGLLLETPADVPAYFHPVRDRLSDLAAWLAEAGMTQLEGCLKFAIQSPVADKVIVGVTSARELSQICGALRRLPDGPLDFSGWRVSDPSVIDPSTWPPRQELWTRPTEKTDAVH